MIVNLVGLLAVGGFTAWLGKLLALGVIASAVLGVVEGDFQLVAISPLLALFDITNIYAQWLMAVTSIFVDG